MRAGASGGSAGYRCRRSGAPPLGRARRAARSRQAGRVTAAKLSVNERPALSSIATCCSASSGRPRPGARHHAPRPRALRASDLRKRARMPRARPGAPAGSNTCSGAAILTPRAEQASATVRRRLVRARTTISPRRAPASTPAISSAPWGWVTSSRGCSAGSSVGEDAGWICLGKADLVVLDQLARRFDDVARASVIVGQRDCWSPRYASSSSMIRRTLARRHPYSVWSSSPTQKSPSCGVARIRTSSSCAGSMSWYSSTST